MSSRTRAASVSFRARGHTQIAATHDKTIEITRAADITRRATCVVAVAAEYDDADLRQLRGDVEVSIECDGAHDRFRATTTPFFLGDNSLVLRRGEPLRERTFAYAASKTAAELDRNLVAKLSEATQDVHITIRSLGTGDYAGALFVVSLPIGNDDDLSPRARRVLEAVDVVLVEDTRKLRDLASRTGLELSGVLVSYHDHNEATRSADVIDRLRSGARAALVSDAGTPLFSDPGYVVVRDAIDAGIEVSPIPGPAALVSVVSVCGLPVDRFTYVGFLSRRAEARRRSLQQLVHQRTTFVLHEAPHRVGALLADLGAVAPEWRVCIGREVTKEYEEFMRGTAVELAAAVTEREPRGEFTMVIAPPEDANEAADIDDERFDALLRALLDQGVTTKTLATALGSLPGVRHKEAYARVLALTDRA
ncbi:MAG TPA: 16S rRNA (cytidine(1402)-2'-O)-methyltransferase [Acidimicrobiia bacterium]|nr:16S rRNA (cytidine(1402)-2'-O)-methyltransferase [Acidimicrobiia bacterium]